jgi:hypothetical protein
MGICSFVCCVHSRSTLGNVSTDKIQQSCLSSAFSTYTSAWSSHCTSTAPVASCVSSACPSSEYATVSSLQSSLCSAYSSCTTSSASCTGWGPWGGPLGWGGSSWGGVGPNGWYTLTASNSGQTGLTTTTVTVTTTETDSTGATTTETVTSVQTGTFVAAQVAGTATTIATETSTSTSHNAAPTLGFRKNSIEALVVVGVVVMVAL